MGTEILILFCSAPIVAVLVSIIRIIQKKYVWIHALLITLSIVGIGYAVVDTHLSGFHYMQGALFGSLFYLPAYILYWVIAIVIIKIISRQRPI